MPDQDERRRKSSLPWPVGIEMGLHEAWQIGAQHRCSSNGFGPDLRFSAEFEQDHKFSEFVYRAIAE